MGSTAFRRDALSYRVGDELLGRYRVTGVLGRGGFGAVYSAEHMGTLQPIALKLLTLDPDAADDDVVARFYREAQVTAQLKSRHTVRVFDVGELPDGPVFMAMELLEGVDLEAELRRLKRLGQTMAFTRASELCCQVLRSLSEAHAHGLVHRDLKPANIMLPVLDGEMVAKVLDFGIAKTVDSSMTAAGKALGTPSYMSPEQCQGWDIDGRSDLYAIGVLLYRCLTGELPFRATDPIVLLRQHITDEPTDPRLLVDGLPDGLAEAVLKALAKSPADRFDDAQSMRQTLGGAVGGALDYTPVTPRDGLLDAGTWSSQNARQAPDQNHAAETVAIDRPSVAVASDTAGTHGSAVTHADTTPASETPSTPRKKPLAGLIVVVAFVLVAAGIVVSAGRDAGPSDAAQPLQSSRSQQAELRVDHARPAQLAVPIAASPDASASLESGAQSSPELDASKGQQSGDTATAPVRPNTPDSAESRRDRVRRHRRVRRRRRTTRRQRPPSPSEGPLVKPIDRKSADEHSIILPID